MLVLLVCWLLVAWTGATLGISVLRVLEAVDVFGDAVDVLVTATWIGLGMMAAIAMLTGFWGPIGWPAAVLIVLTASLLSGPRKALTGYLGSLSRPQLIAGALVALALAAHAAAVEVDAYDTALYHQPLVTWLSQFGLVPGLAWFDFRFGLFSSWFALAAVGDHGVLQGRMSAVAGEFTVLMSLLHWMSRVELVLGRCARVEDWFLLVAYLPLIGAAWMWHYDVSLGADFPTWVLSVLFVWAGVVVFRSGRGFQTRLLPLMLASMATAMKLSAAPLLALGLAFPFIQGIRPIGRANRRSVAIACAIFLLPLLLLAACNAVISGCPLYPSQFACLTTDWAVTPAFAAKLSIMIRDFARWSRGSPDPNSLAWLKSWLVQKQKAGLLLLVLGGTAVVVWEWGRTRSRALLWALATALSGLALLFVAAPNPRFGLGYFFILPALAAGILLGGRDFRFRFATPVLWAVSAICICGLAAIDVRHRGARLAGLPGDLLLPKQMVSHQGDVVHIFNQVYDRWVPLRTKTASHGGLTFESPETSDQCFNLPQPCVASIFDPGFRLRDPAAGLKAGFVRQPGP